ncbi:hypothetical protein ACTID9_03285 [Brevibacillus fluminis]|uniref:hypothetical protein n=1 Tax=Brevibacillus fluminis TaxID=511487 RepID=UPI003F8AF4E0
MVVQEDKNLVLYAADGTAFWAAGIHPAGVSGHEHCVLEDDGDLKVYNRGGLLWSANSAPFYFRS